MDNSTAASAVVQSVLATQQRDALQTLVKWVEAEPGAVDILGDNAGASSRLRNNFVSSPTTGMQRSPST